MKRRDKSLPTSRKFWIVSLAGKIMATVYWDTKEIVLIVFLPRGCSITKRKQNEGKPLMRCFVSWGQRRGTQELYFYGCHPQCLFWRFRKTTLFFRFSSESLLFAFKVERTLSWYLFFWRRNDGVEWLDWVTKQRLFLVV